MQIKIYTKAYTPLTTLVQTRTESDFNNLTYTDTLGQVGSCSFVMRLDRNKANLTNLKHYNIIEICEDDGTKRWVGVIVDRQVHLNTVVINCYSLIHLLTKRLTGASDTFTGTASAAITSLLTTTNAVVDSKISAGTINNPTTINVTLSRSSIFDALKTIAEASNGQFKVNPDKTLDFKSSIGNDLSANVVFQYQISLISSANIVTFQVEDDAKGIATKTFGESGAYTSTQSDSSLQSEYGLFEEYKNFRELNNQTTLDNMTAGNNRNSELSPLLDLSPGVKDNFEVGDLVKVIITNNLVSINAVYQVTEKKVTIKGGNQRKITIRVNSNNSDFFKQIKDLKRDINLLIRTL